MGTEVKTGKEANLIGLECQDRLVECSPVGVNEPQTHIWSELVYSTSAAVWKVTVRAVRVESGRPVRGHCYILDGR